MERLQSERDGRARWRDREDGASHRRDVHVDDAPRKSSLLPSPLCISRCPPTHARTHAQLQEIEQNWQEPLHEYSQFAAIIKKLLVYRHQKHVQLEMTQDALEARREALTELEKSEREARRLDEALGRGRAGGPSAAGAGAGAAARAGAEGEGEGEVQEDAEEQQEQEPGSAFLPPHPGPNPTRRRAPGMGLLSALSYTLHGMMDADPETARRNGISKTRETISQVRLWREHLWRAC